MTIMATYTLFKSHAVITWSVVMDPMNVGSRIVNFILIVNFIHDSSLHITLKYTTLVHMRSSHGRKSRGGRGGPVPPTILQVGDTISNVPPHVFVVGRFFVKKIRILTKFVDFFFFLLVRMSESDRRVPLICRLKIVNADGAAEKKVSESPPPLISFFGSCATMGWRRGG